MPFNAATNAVTSTVSNVLERTGTGTSLTLGSILLQDVNPCLSAVASIVTVCYMGMGMYKLYKEMNKPKKPKVGEGDRNEVND